MRLGVDFILVAGSSMPENIKCTRFPAGAYRLFDRVHLASNLQPGLTIVTSSDASIVKDSVYRGVGLPDTLFASRDNWITADFTTALHATSVIFFIVLKVDGSP